VHNMPVAADIHRHYPDAIIDWVVEEAFVGLVRLNRHVNQVIPFALRRWRKSLFASETHAEIRQFIAQLQKESYDFVLDTQGLLKTGLILGFSKTTANGAKVGMANATAGSNHEGLSKIFHNKSIYVDSRTHVVTKGRLIPAKAMGYEIDPEPDFGLEIPDSHPDWLPEVPYAIFFHGSAREDKKWEKENWIALSRPIIEHGLHIVLPWGSEQEKKEALSLHEAIPQSTVLPRLSVTDVVLLTASAKLVVGVDTGFSHVAAALHRPSIQLYRSTPRWKTECIWSDNVICLGDDQIPPSIQEAQAALHTLLPRIN